MFNNKLPIGQTSIKRGWKGDGNCCVCGVGESVDHIFFHYVLAKMFWAIFKEVFDLETVPDHLGLVRLVVNPALDSFLSGLVVKFI